MTSNRIIKVAVAGLGRIAWQYHLPNILRHPQFELVGVADPLPERTAEAKATFGVQGLYQSLTEMLEGACPELLVIASPTCFHLEQAQEAFARGVDVICEKPLAGNYADATRIVEAMKRFRRKMMVYQPLRLTHEAVALRQILDSGVLGEVFMVRRTRCAYSRRNDWQAFTAYGGGMLNNYGSHCLDQLVYMFGGDLKSVHASLRRMIGGGDAEDFVKILAVNGKGITFDLEINMSSAFSDNEWLVCGTTGAARLNTSSWEVRYCDRNTLKPLDVQSGLAAANRSYPVEKDIQWQEKTIPLTTEPPEFYDCCYRYFAMDEAPLVSVEETMEVLRVLDQCRSQASMGVVPV